MKRLVRLAVAGIAVASLALGLLAGCSGKQAAPEDNPKMSAQEKQDRADKEGK